MKAIAQDLRYGVRVLLRDRSFSVVAILTLALGIGISTALFSLIDSVFLRPLPYSHPEELVSLEVDILYQGRRANLGPSMSDLRTWRATEGVFSHVGMGRLQGIRLRQPIVEVGEPERVTVGSASEDLLEVFGVRPLLGRTFTLDDTKDGSPDVALIAYRYWRDRFGGASDILGRVVRIRDKQATIVGVLPKGFYDTTLLWQPERFSPQRADFRGSGTPVYGRLRPGVSFAQAKAALEASSQAANRGPAQVTNVSVTSLYTQATEDYRHTIALLSSGVACLVLIACVNVSALLLARGSRRQAELAVRASMGATRGRLIRQLLTESIVLATVSGTLGVSICWLSLDALVGLIPLRLPPNSAPAMNLQVLGLTAGLSMVSAVAFGLLPAIAMSRARPDGHLAGVSRARGVGLSKHGGQGLIAIEVSMAVVLLAGAGLMLRSFDRLLGVDVGFDPDAVLMMEVEPVDPVPAVREQFYTELLQRLQTLPEIAAVGAVDSGTLAGGATEYVVREPETHAHIVGRQVRPGYFEALGLKATLGRLPTEIDRTSAEPVVVINQEAARVLFPNVSPLDRTIQTAIDNDPPRRIIGVVPNVRYGGPQSPVRPESYRLARENDVVPHAVMAVVVRMRPGGSVSSIRLRQLAYAVEPRVVIGRISTGSDWLDQKVNTAWHRTMLFSLLGSFGLLLTLTGIFSVTAYAVARRTREVGVRMAVGAPAGHVVRMMVKDACWPILLGLGSGLGGAYFGTAVVQSFLFETGPHDLATFAGVALLTACTACLAAWLPARRAARISPVEALRVD